MKKLLVIMLLVMGALAVNAQRTPVKQSDLPKGVSDSISREYTGYTIKDASKVVENNMTTYEVVITKGSAQKTLTFDAQGKSLKSKSGMGHDMDKSKTTPNEMDKSRTTPQSPSSSPSATPNSSSPSSTPSTSPSTTPPQR